MVEDPYSINSRAAMGSPYYRDMDEPISPAGGGHHRSRSATRAPTHTMEYPREQLRTRYQSLDRGLVDPHDREFIPIREPRDRSRDRSLERGLYLEEELYGRPARQSMPDRGYLGDLQVQNNDLQRELGNLKKELELTNQKLGSSMHSIKTFWSPELKKERALRKEESAKYSLINDQLKLLNSENQKQAMLVRQLEEELRLRMRAPNIEMQQQMEALYAENEHLQREISILRDTIKELELRIETQKQTLQARDESIKKLLEMLQSKGMGKEEERQMFQQMQALAQKQMFDYETCSTTPELTRNLYQGQPSNYSTNYTSTTMLDRAARLPARRYSISGLPSNNSLIDYCNLSENAANLYSQSANITNLLSETTKSLSRSSNILNMRYAQTPTMTHQPIGSVDSLMSHPSLYQNPQLQQPLQPPPPPPPPPPPTYEKLMPMPTNFCSYPNVNTHMPNYNTSNMVNYVGGYRPSSDYLLSKPIYSNTYANSPIVHSQPHSILSQTKNILSQHYASNPIMSRSLTNLPSSSSSFNFLNRRQFPVDYPPFMNDYGNLSYKNNPYYQSSFSKLDLDYSRANDMKRQVSFKFDVDTLSFDS